MKKLAIVFVAMCIAVVTAQALTGYEVMKKTDDRYSGDDGVSKIKMVITNSRQQTRTREIVLSRKKMDKVKDISYSFIFFIQPADVKDTTFLVQEQGSGLDDNQWIYLPATRKVRKIASSERDKSFMGTDFSYDDMSDRDIDEFNHELVKESDIIDGQDCYVVKSVKKKDPSYASTVAWINKSNWCVVKAHMYDKKNPSKIKKILVVHDLRLIQNIWTPGKTVMYSLKPTFTEGADLEKHFESKTVLTIASVKYNVNLDTSIFTQGNMERPKPYTQYIQ